MKNVLIILSKNASLIPMTSLNLLLSRLARNARTLVESTIQIYVNFSFLTENRNNVISLSSRWKIISKLVRFMEDLLLDLLLNACQVFQRLTSPQFGGLLGLQTARYRNFIIHLKLPVDLMHYAWPKNCLYMNYFIHLVPP